MMQGMILEERLDHSRHRWTHTRGLAPAPVRCPQEEGGLLWWIVRPVRTALALGQAHVGLDELMVAVALDEALGAADPEGGTHMPIGDGVPSPADLDVAVPGDFSLSPARQLE